MTNEAGYVRDQAIDGLKKEMAKLRKERSQDNKYTSIASAKKATKDKLTREMEVAKKALTEALQEELNNQTESTGDENRDKIRKDTAKWLIHFIKDDRLPTLKPGNRTDQSELAIYINELQALTKETQ